MYIKFRANKTGCRMYSPQLQALNERCKQPSCTPFPPLFSYMRMYVCECAAGSGHKWDQGSCDARLCHGMGEQRDGGGVKAKIKRREGDRQRKEVGGSGL